jgi:hypothetical protein
VAVHELENKKYLLFSDSATEKVSDDERLTVSTVTCFVGLDWWNTSFSFLLTTLLTV